MNAPVTKDDLRQFGLLLINDIKKLLEERQTKAEVAHPEWIKTRSARKIMDNMSAASLQNLRITGKVRYKKILGSYYYNKSDLLKLFDQ